jgi:hypothetical protein
MAAVVGKMAFDHIHADDDHLSNMAQSSKNWKTIPAHEQWRGRESGVPG